MPSAVNAVAPASTASVIANPAISMTIVSLRRIYDKLRYDFPPGLSGIKNGPPISYKWAKGRRGRGLWLIRLADLSASIWN